MSGFAFAVLFVVVVLALVVAQELLGVVELPLWELVLPDSVDILSAWGCVPLWDSCLFLLTKLKLLPCTVEDCVDVVGAEGTWDDKLDVVVISVTNDVVAVVVSKEEAVVDPVVRSLLAVDASVDADVVPAVVGWKVVVVCVVAIDCGIVVDCKEVVDCKPVVNTEVVATVVDFRLVFAVVSSANCPGVVPAESAVVNVISEVNPLDTASEVLDWEGPCVEVESTVLPKVDELTADTVVDVTDSIVVLCAVWVGDWEVVLESRYIKMDNLIF